MQTPRTEINPRTLLHTLGAYVMARLYIDEEAAPALSIMTAAQANLAERLQIYEEIQIANIRAMAVRDHAGRELGRVIKSVAFAIKSVNNNATQSTLYWIYFPVGFSKPANGSLIGRIEAATVILEKLAEESIEPVAAMSEPLREAKERLSAALAAYRDSTTELKAGFELLSIERQRWIHAYRACHGTLTALFPEDRSRVESFFRSFGRRRSRATDAQTAESGPEDSEQIDGTDPVTDARNTVEEAAA